MRATGRTFRTVLNAALALSEGQNMVVVCINYSEAQRFIQSVLRIFDTQGIVEHPLLTHTKYHIKFMDTHLTTISVHDRNSPAFKGRGNIVILEDY